MDDLQRRFERLGPLFQQLAAPALASATSCREGADGTEPYRRARSPPARAPWGFATTPSLEELTRTAEAELAQLLAPSVDNGDASPVNGGGGERTRCPSTDDDGSAAHAVGYAAAVQGYTCTAFRDALASSRTYRSPHCETAMAEALGVPQLYGGLVGSAVAPMASPSALELMRTVLKDHINAAWSLEAVKQGVAHAKQGNYEEAHRCYAKALELHPASAEAYVARGAAHANQRSFEAADQDFRTALQLDPAHHNAAVYLEAIGKHVEEQREAQRQQQQRDLERQLQEREKQQRDEQARRRSEQPLRQHGPDHSGLRQFEQEREREQATQTAGVGPGRRPDGRQQQQPGSAPAVLRQQPHQGSGSSSSTSSSGSGSGTGSRGGSPGESSPAAVRRQQQPGQPLDIRRALEVVLKARKSNKKSKHRKKSKHKRQKHKKRRRE